MQAIILAGGFGTRLQTVVKEQPKVLAPIGNKPFLHWLVKYLQKYGIEKFVFSLGYLHGQVQDFLKEDFKYLNYSCVIEDQPLGTGGAINFCLDKVSTEDVFIINGDSFFNVDIKQLFQFYKNTNSDCTIGLKPMQNFDRYGSVTINSDNKILQFNEKQFCKEGFINSGVWVVNKSIYWQRTQHLPQNFSYEKDFLEPNMPKLKVTGFVADEYFIDIGIPKDYYKAQTEIPNILQNI